MAPGSISRFEQDTSQTEAAHQLGTNRPMQPRYPADSFDDFLGHQPACPSPATATVCPQ
jgi:hypothetical protein